MRVVSTMSVGYGTRKFVFLLVSSTNAFPEHADLKELSKRNIRFGYTPDVLTDAGRLY